MPKVKRTKPVKYYSPRRRAVYARGDSIDALVLFILHNWTCFLCKQPIDPRKRCPDYRAATIEHLVPISKGGGHSWDNAVPAHARCNFDKSDTGLDKSSHIVVHSLHVATVTT